MDQQIRLREPAAAMVAPSATAQARPVLTLPAPSAKANAHALRQAILDCAAGATDAEPANTEMRMYSFLARLSGKMESLGERELDSVLWRLTETKPSQAKVG